MFYVYKLIDPRNNLPFYVGKGTGLRAKSHLKESEWWYNKRKGGRIKKLLSLNLEPIIEYIFYTENEEEAYLFEEDLIKKLGRVGFEEHGILLNLTLGSRPPSRAGLPGTFLGKKHSEETKQKLREANKKQFLDPNQREMRRIKSKELWSDPNFRDKAVCKKGREATKTESYVVYFSDGTEIIINNLHKWCRETGYPLGTLRDTLPQRRGNIPQRGKCKGMYIRIYDPGKENG